MKKILIFFCCLATVSLGLFSCGNMDENYRDHLKKEVTYSGKIDSLNIFPGTGRVLLMWKNPSDQRSKSILITYEKDDGTVAEITYDSLVDSVYVDGLTKTAYEFTVYTCDAYGNRSIPVSKSITLFPPNYKDNVDNPSFSGVEELDGSKTLIISGMSGPLWMFGGSVSYKIIGDDGSVIEGSKDVPVDFGSLSSNYSNFEIKDLDLKYDVHYMVSCTFNVYPARFNSKSGSGVITYTAVGLDETIVNGEGAFDLPPVKYIYTPLWNFDNLDGWSGGGWKDLHLDTGDKTEGEASTSFTTTGGNIVTFQRSFPAVDSKCTIAMGYFLIDIYVSDAAAFYAGDSGDSAMEISSSGSSDREEISWPFMASGALALNIGFLTDGTPLHDGWNHLELKLSEAKPQGGSIRLNAVNHMRFYRFRPGADIVVKFDNFRFRMRDMSE